MFILHAKKYRKLLAYSIILSLQLNSFAYAASVVTPDKSQGKNPGVSQAANGVQVIDIRLPNAKGLSHNQYTNLQVGREGIIFNNAGQITKTQLAGYINGNRHLAGDISARAILNEVTGKVPTSLNGYLEIAGKKADLIIANPNGIVGSNFGYINTGRAVLTTGKPFVGPEGDLRGLNVSKGTITIESLGLDAKTADSAEIYARAAKLNAAIWAQKLNITTGSNEIDYRTGQVAKVLSDEDLGVSLDVAALGGMYAGQIFLIGTAKGLGVNMEGNMHCLDTDVIVTQNGDIINKGKLGAKGNVNIATNGRMENSGIVYGQNKVNLDSSRGITNKGSIAGVTVDVVAKDGNVDTSGKVYGKEKIEINSSKAVMNSGTINGGIVDAIAADGNINNSGTISGHEKANINSSKALANTGLINGGTLAVTARDGNIETSGEISAKESLYITSGKAVMNKGKILGNIVDVTAKDGDINNGGCVQGQKSIQVESSKAITNTGTISGGTMNIAAKGGSLTRHIHPNRGRPGTRSRPGYECYGSLCKGRKRTERKSRQRY